VGANDLMQYFFAADRDNARVSDRYDVLSPPALGLFQQISQTCQKYEIPVSVCGETASRPLEAAVLVALGFQSLSMSASNIGPVKSMISRMDAGKLGTWIADHMNEPVNSLRTQLIEAGEEAGLPSVAVDNAVKI